MKVDLKESTKQKLGLNKFFDKRPKTQTSRNNRHVSAKIK